MRLGRAVGFNSVSLEVIPVIFLILQGYAVCHQYRRHARLIVESTHDYLVCLASWGHNNVRKYLKGKRREFSPNYLLKWKAFTMCDSSERTNKKN